MAYFEFGNEISLTTAPNASNSLMAAIIALATPSSKPSAKNSLGNPMVDLMKKTQPALTQKCQTTHKILTTQSKA
jgi:hypothetical protein